jgi:RimJ/RimL family protein N-acetyltransferase
MPFSPLVTERLALRHLGPEDAPSVFRYRSLPEVRRFQAWEPASLAEVETVLRSNPEDADVPGTWLQLALDRREDGEMLGDCGIHFPPGDRAQAEVGITVAPEHQGRGYAVEALGAVLNFLFDTLRKHRVHASVDPDNRASIRLLERLGMRREGHLVESLWFRGRWADDVLFALLDREWRERMAKPRAPAPSWWRTPQGKTFGS